MEQVTYTKTFEQTQKLAQKLAAQPDMLQVIALHGNLGSGKTTFVQGFARQLGIHKRLVSPTFIIMRTYEIPQSETKKTHKKYLYHIDLYRIEGERDIEGLGIIEIMKDPKNIVAIEWPEKIAGLLSPEATNIYFEYIDETTRKITIPNLNNK
jgi:tRNA threonylcarbamoyladenosine biosynthesis protein TsaE